MTAADSNLGAEILQQALATGKTMPTNYDQSAGNGGARRYSTQSTNVANSSRRGHKGSASVSFADGGIDIGTNAPHYTHHPYFHQAAAGGGMTQIPYITYPDGQVFEMPPMPVNSPQMGYPQGAMAPHPAYPAHSRQTSREFSEQTSAGRSRAGTQNSQHQAVQSTAPSTVASPNVVYHRPIPHPGGLPQSKSHHSALASNVGFASPEQKTPPKGGAHGDDSGFLCSPQEPVTEPRNYAPRAVALKDQPLPPWELAASERSDAMKKAGMDDPFITDDSQSSSTALVATPGSPPQQVVNTSRPEIYELPGASSSQHLCKLLKDGKPSFETAMDPDNFPFMESCRTGPATNHGVIKIRNIPFSTKRAEVIAFLGRNSKILNDSDEPVHIIMDRVTSKTMDAYVEFVTLDDAMRAVERHNTYITKGRPSRLGDRSVEVELSSQGQLMKDLYPLARGIIWNGANPEFKPHSEFEPWENFKGFISEEEMIMIVKHVEVPHRSPFSKECPQRPYECLISTIKKFPWHKAEQVSIAQRRSMFKATCQLLRLLNNAIQNNKDPVNLNMQLLRRLTTAAMNCPGFTVCMKDDIACVTDMSAHEQRMYEHPVFAECWLHQYALAPKPGVQSDVLEWYIKQIRQQSQRDMMGQPVGVRNILQEKAQDTNSHWGYFWNEVGYFGHMGPQFDHMCLSECADMELYAIERILQRALTPQIAY